MKEYTSKWNVKLEKSIIKFKISYENMRVQGVLRGDLTPFVKELNKIFEVPRVLLCHCME